MARLYWRGAHMVVPSDRGTGVIEPADLASEAIEDAISGRRRWNPEQDFLQFLQGAVDSKISHLVTSAESQRTRKLVAAVEGKDPFESVAVRAPDGGDPETIV